MYLCHIFLFLFLTSTAPLTALNRIAVNSCPPRLQSTPNLTVHSLVVPLPSPLHPIPSRKQFTSPFPVLIRFSVIISLILKKPFQFNARFPALLLPNSFHRPPRYSPPSLARASPHLSPYPRFRRLTRVDAACYPPCLAVLESTPSNVFLWIPTCAKHLLISTIPPISAQPQCLGHKSSRSIRVSRQR